MTDGDNDPEPLIQVKRSGSNHSEFLIIIAIFIACIINDFILSVIVERPYYA